MRAEKLKLSESELDLLSRIRRIGPKAIIFDLDNTLYFEKVFAEHFASALASRLTTEVGEHEAANLKKYYLDNWHSGRRRGLFQATLAEFKITSADPNHLFEMMRGLSVPNGLPLRNWAKIALSEWSVPKSVLTNGDPQVQNGKFSQLQPAGLLVNVPLVCAKEFEPKPSAVGAEFIIGAWDINPDEVLFVGDSEVDEECAKSTGCQFLYC